MIHICLSFSSLISFTHFLFTLQPSTMTVMEHRKHEMNVFDGMRMEEWLKRVEKKGEGLMDETVLCVSMSSFSSFHQHLVHSHVHQCVMQRWRFCGDWCLLRKRQSGDCVLWQSSANVVTHSIHSSVCCVFVKPKRHGHQVLFHINHMMEKWEWRSVERTDWWAQEDKRRESGDVNGEKKGVAQCVGSLCVHALLSSLCVCGVVYKKGWEGHRERRQGRERKEECFGRKEKKKRSHSKSPNTQIKTTTLFSLFFFSLWLLPFFLA